MASKVLALSSRAQDSLFTDVFTFSTGDDLIIGQSTAAANYTLQRRSTTGSSEWSDTAVTGALSTSANVIILASSLTTIAGSGHLFRFRLSAPARVWVAVDPATSEFELGSVTAPLLTPPASNLFTPVPFPPLSNNSLGNLAAGTVVFMFMGGQSNWEGGGPNQFTGAWPTKSKFWDAGQFKIINSTNGFRTAANPTVFLAKKFEEQYPNLELWVVEDGEGGSGFYNNKWEVGGALRTRFLSKVGAAYTFALAQNRDIFFAGLQWNQGEADAYNPYAPLYGSALSGFVTAVRGVSRTDAPFVPVRISINQILFDQRAVVRAVHASYPVFTDIDAIPLHTDNVHYTEVGYKAIGEAQFASLLRTPITRISTYVVPNNNIYDFRSLSAPIPGFTATLVTWDYRVGFVELSRGANNNWSTAYLTGPVMRWNLYDILITFQAQGLNAIGLSDNYSTGLFNAAGESLMVIQSGSIFYKGAEVTNLAGPWVSGKTYSLKFSRVGTSVIITQTNITDNLPPESDTITNVGLAAPRAIMDSAYSDVKIIEVAEVIK